MTSTRSFAEDTVETSTTTGTVAYTLAGPKGDYFPFEASFVTGDMPVYVVRNYDNTKIEFNRGGVFTEGSPATLARGVWKSTNGDAPVSWTTDDHPLTIYIPGSAELHEGVVTGWLATARHALLRAGAAWWDYTLGIGATWIEKLYTGAADIEKGRAHIFPGIYASSPRKLWEDVGAASLTLDIDDVGKVLCFDCTGGQRTATLLASATAKHGYCFDVVAYGSGTNGVTLAPNGSDAINQLRIPPGGRWTVEWDGAKSKWWVYPVVAVVPGQIFGLTLSTAGSSATFTIAAGSASDKNNADSIVLAAALSKTTSAWAVGSGNGGLDTGSIANSIWYHVHLIKRVDTGVVDALISTSATAPTLPTGYTLSRRIGSIQTNGSAQWVKFQQDGDRFYRLQIGDYTVTGTFAATLRTLSIPLGIVTRPILSLTTQAVANASTTIQAAPAADATLLNFIAGQYEGAAAEGSTSYSTCDGPPSNTSSQVYFAVPTYISTATIASSGWIDRRG